MLRMVIAGATDAAAMATWDRYNQAADHKAPAHLLGHAAADVTAQETSMAAAIQRPPAPINCNMGTLVGSDATVARPLDAAAAMPGVKDLMPTFDDVIGGMEDFGTRIQPPMRCRRQVMQPA